MRYSWLLNWGMGQMGREQHYTLTPARGDRTLTTGLTFLIEDLKAMARRYFSAVANDAGFQANLSDARAELRSYTIRI